MSVASNEQGLKGAVCGLPEALIKLTLIGGKAANGVKVCHCTRAIIEPADGSFPQSHLNRSRLAGRTAAWKLSTLSSRGFETPTAASVRLPAGGGELEQHFKLTVCAEVICQRPENHINTSRNVKGAHCQVYAAAPLS